jgi:hypothetical protein
LFRAATRNGCIRLLQSHEFQQSLAHGTAISITCWLHGFIWYDPFQFLFSRQTGFYNGSFSPQEEVLAWKRTNETYLSIQSHKSRDCYNSWDSSGWRSTPYESSSYFRHWSSLINLFLKIGNPCRFVMDNGPLVDCCCCHPWDALCRRCRRK